MLILSILVQGIIVPIPSAFQSFIPSTLSSSHTTSPTTSTPTEASTSTDASNPPAPNMVPIVGAVIGIVAAMFIGVFVFICWKRRRRRRRPHNDTRTPGVGPRGVLGRLKGWRTGYTLSRADTVSSWFAGREEKDDPGRGLLPKESHGVLPSQQSGDPKFGYTSRDASATSPNFLENQLAPPLPPPSYLGHNTLGSMGEDWMREDWMREEWMRRTSSPAPPASLSGNPFATPSHSRTSSYDPPGRYPDGPFAINSLPSTAMSLSTPFSGVKPFLGSDGNTPPSSASSPRGLQELKLELAAREHWIATEGSAPHVPPRAIAAASHVESGPAVSPEKSAAAKGMHRRNLTIETANLGASRSIPDTQRKSLESTGVPGVPANPAQDRAHDTDALPGLAHLSSPNGTSDEDADATAELQKMFTCGTPLSDYEMHESICGRFQTTPTEGCHELRSPAAPESATMEMFGIGFGVMGGKWEPRRSDSNWSASASASANPNVNANDAGGFVARLPSASNRRTKKSIRTPLGPMRIQQSIKRGASVLSTSASASCSHGDETPPSSDQKWETPSASGEPSSYQNPNNGSHPTQGTSTGAVSSLPDVYRVALGPGVPQQAKETIVEVDENAPSVLLPGAAVSDGNASPTATPSGGGGGASGTTTTGGGGGGGTSSQDDAREPAQYSPGENQGSNLTPRTAPPRHSVVPDDFSSEEGQGLSRANTRKWQ